MNHSEAVEQMAVERYLLDDMGPDIRDAFEEHMFDCTECAMDVRAGVVFIDEAKRQLPNMASARKTQFLGREDADCEENVRVVKAHRDWFAWLRPVVLAPTFAVLLGVVAYQNFVTVPGLRQAADAPRIVTLTPLHGATRGEHQKVATTRAIGLTIPVDLAPADGTSYGSYLVELVDSQGKVAWSVPAQAPAADAAGQPAVSIPGRILENGSYTVNIVGVDAHGARTTVEAYPFDLEVKK